MQDPEDAVEHQAVVLEGVPAAVVLGQQGLQHLPLRVGQRVSLRRHHSSGGSRFRKDLSSLL
jgi:hypothetical protein